jgi:hypothetical protein
MLATDSLYRNLPNGRELFEAHRLNSRVSDWFQRTTGSVPREQRIAILRAAGNLTNVRSARFVGHFQALP